MSGRPATSGRNTLSQEQYKLLPSASGKAGMAVARTRTLVASSRRRF